MIYSEQITLTLDQLIESNFILIKDKCGTGKYQILALSILVFIDLNDGCELILMSFLMPILKQEWQLTSMQIQVLTSIFYLGMVIGSLLTGFIADKKGRHKCIYISCILQFFTANLFLICNNANQMIIARFLYGFVYGFSIPLTTTMISEITAPNVRGRFLIIINFFVSIGKIYAFVLAYLCLQDFSTGHWRLMMCLSSLTSLIVGVLSYFHLMESPRYLLASGNVVEGLNIVEEIIHQNKDSPQWLQNICTIPNQIIESIPFQGSKYGYISKDERIAIESWVRKTFRVEKRGNIRELLNTHNIQTTIRLWIIWFCINFMYFGQLIILPFILGKKQKSFGDYLLTVLGEIPSIIISLLIVEIPYLGRRNTMAIAFIIASILHFLSFHSSWPYFFTRFFMKEGWAMLYPYTTEIFSTQNRTLGFGSSAAVGRFGAAICPYILIPLYELEIGLPFLAFGVSSAISFIACATLPYDTVGRCLDFQYQDNDLQSNKEDEVHEILCELIERKNNIN